MNPIYRQHERTNFPELRGARCSDFKAVADGQCKFHGLFFIRFANVWHRFYLDAGLLFWEEGAGPDPENDLLDGEQYWDIGEQLCAIGVAVSDIEMADSRLTMQFKNGARLILRHGAEDDGTEVVDLVRGDPTEDEP